MRAGVLGTFILLLSLPAIACEDPDAVLSVGDKSKARVSYLKCLIDVQRSSNSRYISVVASDVENLRRQVIDLQGEIRDLREQVMQLQSVPYPSK